MAVYKEKEKLELLKNLKEYFSWNFNNIIDDIKKEEVKEKVFLLFLKSFAKTINDNLRKWNINNSQYSFSIDDIKQTIILDILKKLMNNKYSLNKKIKLVLSKRISDEKKVKELDKVFTSAIISNVIWAKESYIIKELNINTKIYRKKEKENEEMSNTLNLNNEEIDIYSWYSAYLNNSYMNIIFLLEYISNKVKNTNKKYYLKIKWLIDIINNTSDIDEKNYYAKEFINKNKWLVDEIKKNKDYLYWH